MEILSWKISMLVLSFNVKELLTKHSSLYLKRFYDESKNDYDIKFKKDTHKINLTFSNDILYTVQWKKDGLIHRKKYPSLYTCDRNDNMLYLCWYNKGFLTKNIIYDITNLRIKYKTKIKAISDSMYFYINHVYTIANGKYYHNKHVSIYKDGEYIISKSFYDNDITKCCVSINNFLI